MSQVDFTVAIPTYNGEKRLAQVLDCLRSQIHTTHFSWEIIVVDNNSTDNTAQLVQNYQADWSEIYPLRYCFEPEQGLAFARRRGVEAARGALIGFLDDDILPAPDWVAEAYRFGQQYPQVGAYGGQIHGNFEVKPPENFTRIQSFLAIRELGEQPQPYRPEVLNLPPGAALVVRKQAWCQAVPTQLTLLGRVNGSMLAGEDYESLLYLHQAGWQIWYNPAMHSTHQIPRHRFEKDYLLSLVFGAGLCIFHLRLIGAKAWQKPLIISKILLGNLRRVLRHWLKYRRQMQTDLVLACEMKFYLSSLLSPFFFLKRWWLLKVTG